jgi:hypothetical protein
MGLLDLPAFGAIFEIQLKAQELPLPAHGSADAGGDGGARDAGMPGVALTWEYASELYAPQTVHRLVARFMAVLAHVVATTRGGTAASSRRGAQRDSGQTVADVVQAALGISL